MEVLLRMRLGAALHSPRPAHLTPGDFLEQERELLDEAAYIG